MIVCHCHVITKAEIKEIVYELLDGDPWFHLTPGSVYHALGKRGKCCGCFPSVIDYLVEIVSEMRANHTGARAEWADMTLVNLRLLVERRKSIQHLTQQRGGTHSERRTTGHRTA